MDGTGSNSDADPGCAGYTPQNPDWYGFDVTNLGDSGPPAKTLTWTVKNAMTGETASRSASARRASSWQAQLGDGRPSPGSGSQARCPTVHSPTQTDRVHSSASWAVLQTRSRDSDVAEPCIESITPFTDDTSGLTVTVSIPAGFAGDPWMGRGG